MSAAAFLDATDRDIIELLRQDARMTVREIGRRVNLSPAPVRRRIDRLESTGVIAGYTALINSAKAGPTVEAVTELRFAGDVNIDQIFEFASKFPEVDEVLTTAGDPDALVRIRVDNLEHLQRVVNQLRTGSVIGTKTMIVLSSWQRRGGLDAEGSS
jgi:Lrp/AsnC family transcriptional regulator, leucine-responsive regulatory protein